MQKQNSYYMENLSIKILAVDDNFDNLVTIQALTFEAFPNAEIILATNGKEALELAVSENPDVILLDIVMPDMDGFEVCRRLKSETNSRDIPVVFVTALKGDKESRIRGLEVGAEAFLAKPIDESELIAQIRAMIKIRKANIERVTENKRLAELVQEQTGELKETHRATLNLLEDLRSEIETRKNTEQALRESEAKFRDMADLLPQVVFEMNLNGKITYLNQQAHMVFGYDHDELIGQNSLKVHIPEESERVKDGIIRKLRGEVIENKEFTLVRKDGTFFPALIYINAIIQNNEPIGIRGVVIDITEQKLAEKSIRESESLYRAILEASPDNVIITDISGNIQMISPSSIHRFGYKS